MPLPVIAPQGLEKPLFPALPIAKSQKASTACLACKRAKTKCSSGSPCEACASRLTLCVYDPSADQRRKIANQHNIKELSKRDDELQQHRSLLEGILSLIRMNEPKTTDDLLSLVRSDAGLPGLTQHVKGMKVSRPVLHRTLLATDGGLQKPIMVEEIVDDMSCAEEELFAPARSPSAQIELTGVIDLGHGDGAIGFIGRMSEISWLARARDHLMHLPSVNGEMFPFLDVPGSIQELNYFSDDTNLLSIDEDQVIAHEIPPPEVALMLSEACFHALQGIFQFVQREPFLHVLVRFPRDKSVLSWAERRWLAMANLVFAIGTKWLDRTCLSRQPTAGSHVEYYARARALGLDHRITVDHPVVEQVQGLGLLAFYLFINGSITRSWTILGQAIRHAISLGLHLKVTHSTTSHNDQERRSQLWYSLHSLEILVTECLGRPRSIMLADVTVPIDPLERANPAIVQSEGSYVEHRAGINARSIWQQFLRADTSGRHASLDDDAHLASLQELPPPAHVQHHHRLCLISHRIGSVLYSNMQEKTRSDVERHIGDFEDELVRWVAGLPRGLVFPSNLLDGEDVRANAELTMYYFSVQMILHRPCLCYTPGRVLNESSASPDFGLRSARMAVEAAIAMLALMPDHPKIHEAYRLLPWWGLLHYVCQAAAVLILELCLDAQHYPTRVMEMVDYLKKAVAYLRFMAATSSSALKAWEIFRQLFTDATAQFVGVDITDVPGNAPPRA